MTHYIIGNCPPCCDGGSEPPPELSPGVEHDCANIYSWCLEPSTALSLNISGFQNCNWSGTRTVLCEPFGFTERPCYCNNTGSNLNGNYTLTKTGGGFDGGLGFYYASFEIALGTYHDSTDRGVLVEECSCGFEPWHPIWYYVYALTCTVRCYGYEGVGGLLMFWDLIPLTHAFDSFDNWGSPAECCYDSCWPGFPIMTYTSGGTPCDGIFTAELPCTGIGLCATDTGILTGSLIGPFDPFMSDENGDTMQTEGGDNLMMEAI